MTSRQSQILAALRHGPLDQMVIARQIGEAPFMVRAELHALRRERFVRDRHERAGHVWVLTESGAAITYGADQLQF